MGRRRTKRSAASVWRRRLHYAAHAAWAWGRTVLAHTRHRLARCRTLRPPRVVVVGAHPARRRLARTFAYAARAYARALGAALPPHTTIMLVPVIVAGDRLHGLLQVVAPPSGPERAVLYLAINTRDASAGDVEPLAVLRVLVTRLLEPATGAPTLSVSVTLSHLAPTSEADPTARVVPLRPRGVAYRNGAVPPGAQGPAGHRDHLAWLDDDPA
jgi:hypothetical protein